MALVVFRRKMVDPPAVAGAIDWGHTLAHGLTRCWLFGQGPHRKTIDLVRGDVMAQARDQADTTHMVSVLGEGYRSGADGGGAIGSQGQLFDSLGAHGLSFAACLRPNGVNWALAANNGIAGTGNTLATDATGVNVARLYYTSAGAVTWCMSDQSANENGCRATVASIAQDRTVTVAASFQRDTAIGTYAGTWQFYCNYFWSGTNNYAGVGSLTGAWADKRYIAGALDKNADPNAAPDQLWRWLYVWRRGLVPTELQAIVADPGQIFYWPQHQTPKTTAAAGRIWQLAGVGGGLVGRRGGLAG